MTMRSTDSTFRLPAVAAPAAREHASVLEDEVTALFDQFRGPLIRYLLSCRLSTHDSEEVVQDVFLALFRHLAAGKPRHNLRGWAFRVAHNLALKRRFRGSDALQFVDRSDAGAAGQLDPGPDPDEQLCAKERQRRLLATVAALPERDRCCLYLRAEGLRYREIADVLGVSLGTVSLSLSRSFARLGRADGV